MNNRPTPAPSAPGHVTVESVNVESVNVGPTATRSSFAELICADPELLRVEFEALITANYPAGESRRLPPRQPVRPRTDQAPPTPPTRAPSQSRPRSESDGPANRMGTRRTFRERGPP
jgi:hypothetical protein